MRPRHRKPLWAKRFLPSLRPRSLEETKEEGNGSIRRRNALRIADNAIVAVSDRSIRVNLPKH